MKLLFKQRIFSWFDSYNIFDEDGNVIYKVKGQLSWGHRLNIYDAEGKKVGTVVEKIITILPKFELYEGDKCIGAVKKEISLINPRYNMESKGWHAKGSWTEWNYTISDKKGNRIAAISKKLLRLVDTYVIDVTKESDALCALMFVLAIDAEKCSKEND